MKKRTRQNGLNIQEITYINELALTVGLIMLTIGNFLGRTVGNESWGRTGVGIQRNLGVN
jgi:ABC-type transport system involved in cytochrome c biogenesis permease subunit